MRIHGQPLTKKLAPTSFEFDKFIDRNFGRNARRTKKKHSLCEDANAKGKEKCNILHRSPKKNTFHRNASE